MDCKNIFNIKRETSSAGSKRERSMDDETVSTDDVENKENIDEVIPCTPKKQWYVLTFMNGEWSRPISNNNPFHLFQH